MMLEFWTALLQNRVIETLTLLFIAGQVWALRKQTMLDHERSRRIRALDDLRWFVEQLKPEHHRIAKVLDEMPSEAIISLRQSKSCKISNNFKNDIERILLTRIAKVDLDLMEKDDTITLSQSSVVALRHVTMSYLNYIEVALSPVFSGVSDETIMKSQMRGYFFHDDGRPKCKAVRQAWGQSALPSSFAFAELLEKEQNNALKMSFMHPLTKRLTYLLPNKN